MRLPCCLLILNSCRVVAPFLLPPPHIAAPPASLVLLSPAACLTSSPQMLCPAVSLGLQDAAALAAAVAGAVKCASSSSSGGGAELAGRVEVALRDYNRRRQPQVMIWVLHMGSQLVSFACAAWRAYTCSPGPSCFAATML